MLPLGGKPMCDCVIEKAKIKKTNKMLVEFQHMLTLTKLFLLYY